MAITCDFCHTKLGVVFNVVYEGKQVFYKCNKCHQAKKNTPKPRRKNKKE